MQEGEDDEDHQAQREQQREVHLVQRILDEARTVEMHLQANAIGQFGLDLRQHRANAVGDRDRVRARLALYRQHDGTGTVVPGLALVILDAILGPAEVFHPQGGAIVIGDDDVAEVRRIGQRHRRLHRIGAAGAVERAGRQVDIGILYRLDHVGKSQPALLQLGGVEVEAQRIFLRTEHQHLRHAGQAGQLLRHARIGDGVELGQGQALGRQRQIHDGRIGRVDLP